MTFGDFALAAVPGDVLLRAGADGAQAGVVGAGPDPFEFAADVRGAHAVSVA